jgi:hypothetical protein
MHDLNASVALMFQESTLKDRDDLRAYLADRRKWHAMQVTCVSSSSSEALPAIKSWRVLSAVAHGV